jgi:hypothetical protein
MTASVSTPALLFVSAQNGSWEEWQQGIIDNQADKRTLEVGLKQQSEKTKNL